MQRLFIFLFLAIATSPLLAQEPIGVEYVPPQAALAVVVHPQAIHNSPILQMAPWEVMSLKTNEFVGASIQDVQSALLFVSPPGADGRPQAGAVVRLAKPIPLDSLFPPLQKAKELVPATMPGSDRRYLDGSKNVQLNVYPVDERTYLLGTPGAIQAMLSQQQTPVASPLAKLLKSDLKDAEFHAFLRVQPIREMAQFLLADPSYKSLPELQELPQQLEHVQLIGSLSQESGGFTLQLTAPNDIEAAKLEKTVQGLLDSSTKAFNQLARPADADSPEGQAIQQYADRVIRTLLTAIQPTRTNNQVTLTTVGKAQTSPQMLLASGTALLVPAIANFKAGVNRSQTTNNLRNILLATHNYFDAYRKMPSDSATEEGKPLLSWRVHILPFLGQTALYNQFHLDEPWDSEHNRNLINKMPATYIPPGSEELAKQGRTRYQHPLGEGLPASKPGDLSLADMTDGTSNTLAVVETPEADAVIWTRPADFEVDLTFPLKSLLPGPGDGINVARYDGSVQYLVRKQLTDQILKGLLTHAGGEVVELIK